MAAAPLRCRACRSARRFRCRRVIRGPRVPPKLPSDADERPGGRRFRSPRVGSERRPKDSGDERLGRGMVCTLVASRGCTNASSAIHWQSHRACAPLPTPESVCHAEKRTNRCKLFAFRNADQTEARSSTQDPRVRGRRTVYKRAAKEVKQSVVRPWLQPVRPPIYRPTWPSLREARPWLTAAAIP